MSLFSRPYKKVEKFVSKEGRKIYRIQARTLPGLINNIYLIVGKKEVVLFDVGSMMEGSQRDLLNGLSSLAIEHGEQIAPEDISLAVISHGHMDHFGGSHIMSEEYKIPLAIHELDAPLLTGIHQRVSETTHSIQKFMKRAGLESQYLEEVLGLYARKRPSFPSLPVKQMLQDGDTLGEGYRVYHVPGHCPGQICLQVDDFLLTADHVLPRITPHQFPESIMPYTGLTHYMDSLKKIKKVGGISMMLPAHEEPMADFRGRVDEIKEFHMDRLSKIRDLCVKPKTLYQITKEHFPWVKGYHVLLAMEEAAAHLEYLAVQKKIKVTEQDSQDKTNTVLIYQAV